MKILADDVRLSWEIYGWMFTGIGWAAARLADGRLESALFALAIAVTPALAAIVSHMVKRRC